MLNMNQNCDWDTRSGFVAITGRPNVGKSTLLNTILGRKVAIVTPKPQTTRNRIAGVKTLGKVQIVFLDTPGIHQHKHLINKYMVEVALRAAADVDVILFLVDARGITDEDREALKRILAKARLEQLIVAVNKVDLATPEEIESTKTELEETFGESQMVFISALKGNGVEQLMKMLIEAMPPGPFYYPEDSITDQPTSFMIAELIREKVFMLTKEEVPYSVAVVVEEVIKRKEDVWVVTAKIFVSRESQKGILIGKGGSLIKKIGQQAREELEALLGVRLFLDLRVKVKKDWMNRPDTLARMGYDLKQL